MLDASKVVCKRTISVFTTTQLSKYISQPSKRDVNDGIISMERTQIGPEPELNVIESDFILAFSFIQVEAWPIY